MQLSATGRSKRRLGRFKRGRAKLYAAESNLNAATTIGFAQAGVSFTPS